jgi:hypothetical protein
VTEQQQTVKTGAVKRDEKDKTQLIVPWIKRWRRARISSTGMWFL